MTIIKRIINIMLSTAMIQKKIQANALVGTSTSFTIFKPKKIKLLLK